MLEIKRQIILSGILQVFGNRIHGYRNSKGMAVNGMAIEAALQRRGSGMYTWICGTALWGKKKCTQEMHGLHLSGKGVAVFADGLSGAVASGLGKVSYLN